MTSKNSQSVSAWLSIAAMTLLITGALPMGCSHITQRGQSPDTEAMEYGNDFEEPTYVGDVARPTGLGELKVDGIGLVTQLDGTGSEPRPSGQRDYLVAEIKTHQVEDITGLLASDTNSIALVMGMIPQGAKKGDRFDVMVQSLKRSETSSLHGGYLMQARMKPFVQTRKSMSFGHNAAVVRGRLVVDAIFDSDEDETNLVSGIIPGGGMVTRDRPNELKIKSEHRSIKISSSISKAVNERFSTHVQGRPEGVANPLNDQVIEMLIPEDYRQNVGRYFHVVMNIAYNESPGQRVNRLEVLERQLHDPKQASISAIRLEAIGEEAKNVLKRGIRGDHPTVQFHSAEALAYMGDNSGVEILRESADTKPAYRWHALTALASIKDATAEDALVTLFSSDSSEARYGAFKTLRNAIPDSLVIDGEFVGREFMLHTVASDSRPMIHISKSEVPEVVIFGGNQRFNDRLMFLQSGLTIKSQGDSQVLMKRYLRNGEEQKILCSSLISDVIRQMVKLEADYGDVIKLLKHARQSEALASQLVINAVPKLSSSYRAVATDAAAELDEAVSERSASAGNSADKPKGIFGDFW